METKQVNVAIPKNLYSKIEEYVDTFGYRNTQDLLLELVRQKVFFEDRELKQEFIDEMNSLKNNDKVSFSSIDELDKLVKNA